MSGPSNTREAGPTRTRAYHVVVVNARTGREVRMTASPLPHPQACVLLSKLTRYPWRRETLREA